MNFGVVLQTNPPAARVIELARQAETYGFSHAWTFDSHLLWEEPFVIYSRILDATHKLMVGPMVTNPATRDWTVTASLFATLNEMYGNRTVCGIGRGDSAVRTYQRQAGEPRRAARVRPGDPRSSPTAARSSTTGGTLRFPWNPRAAACRSGWPAYGPNALKLAGEVGDGFILQLADLDIARVEHHGGARGGRRRGPRPGRADDVRRRAGVCDGRQRRLARTRARAVPLVRRDGRKPRRRHRRPVRGRRRARSRGA